MEINKKLEEGELTSGKHLSYWLESASALSGLHSLNENIETDVVIVGAGLAGLSVGYCLCEKGKNVVILEDGFIGSGESGRTTAQLVTALDDRYYQLESNFGKEKTKLIAESHATAIDFVERTIKKENINCEFERVDGYLFLHSSDKKNSLKKELDSALSAGIDISELENVPAIPNAGKCLRFAGQAQFHPMKYLNGLAAAIKKKGSKIYINTHASEINSAGVITSKGNKVKAKHIVIATNSPVNNKYAMHLKQYAYRTYVIGALIKKQSLPRALWWDTGDFESNPDTPPYHYVRICTYNSEYDLLLSGGEDHPVANTNETDVPEDHRYNLLESWTRKHFDIGSIIYRWSGQILEPMDGIAYIGHNPHDEKNVYIITGDSGNGMTYCTIGGILISDLITGKENVWEEIYTPTRFTIKKSKPFFKEIMGSLMASLKKQPEHKDSVSLSSLQNREGKIIELKGEKYGVFKDENDTLHIVSAVCTHLKCSVKWNNDEKSWDCPCHGSRFTHNGKVINGPANSDLPSYSEKVILKDVSA
ncbi:MAG TPA: FAD-dependent oxidoreductase [Bacteroidia bacterium]|jgi:glycine/D-amino acid oxidase-like deaminating enzyme/nitrite reductase/ring-hydroxylating ferredoxin subunit|nr:FAD-dependent oxidoreductase [Bacteroidia bacterium]